MSDKEIKKIEAKAERLVDLGTMSGGTFATVVLPLITIATNQAKEIENLKQEIGAYKAWTPNAWESAQQLELAVKALERIGNNYDGSVTGEDAVEMRREARTTLSSINRLSGGTER